MGFPRQECWSGLPFPSARDLPNPGIKARSPALQTGSLSSKPVLYASKWHESESHSVVSNSLWPRGLYSPWNSPGQNTGVGSLSLLQGIFPTQWSNPGLPHCRWILYQLSYQGSRSCFLGTVHSGYGLTKFNSLINLKFSVFMTHCWQCGVTSKVSNSLSTVQLSSVTQSNSLRPHESQHARPPCPSPIPGVHPNSCPLSQWCHLAISSSCMDVRVGLWRRLSTKELMLLNYGVREDSWESLGLQGDPTSSFWRRSTLGFLWTEWC